MIERIVEMPFGTITVYAENEKLYRGIIGSGLYQRKFSDVNYNIYLGWDFENTDMSYRAKQMKKGIYLGHNIGAKCKLHIDGEKIHIYCEDDSFYDKIVWAFAIKYIFTKVCLDHNVLHMKATLLRNVKSGKLFVLLGRGGNGKTTIADILCKREYILLSNTHCMIKDDYIWGIDSWIRRREENRDEYILPQEKNFFWMIKLTSSSCSRRMKRMTLFCVKS